jgi:hypothetical protein
VNRSALIVVFASLVALSGACSAVSPPPNPGWRTYEAQDGAFSVDYPEGWESRQIDSNDPRWQIPPELGGVTGAIFASSGLEDVSSALAVLGGQVQTRDLRLGVMVLSEPIDPSPRGTAEIIRNLSEGNRDFSLLAYEPVTVDGQTGFRFAFSWTGTTPEGQEASATVNMAFFVLDGREFAVTEAAFSGTYAENQDIVDHFMQSLNFH